MPFRKDSQVLHVLHCSKNANKLSLCTRPCENDDCSTTTRNEQAFVPVYEDSDNLVVAEYRLYIYETRIV